MTSTDKASTDPDNSRGTASQAPSASPSTASGEPLDAQRQSIRKTLHGRRKGLSAPMVADHSRRIAERILPLLAGARHVGGYLAMGNEVKIDALLSNCRRRHCSTYVPLIQPDHSLLFAPLDEHSTIVQNKYGIREPVFDLDACIPAHALDAVLVPLLGFDLQCNRMGMGGGYYDRTFTQRRHAASALPGPATPMLIGVAHELQCVDSVLPEWWDVPLDHVVTEQQVYHRP